MKSTLFVLIALLAFVLPMTQHESIPPAEHVFDFSAVRNIISHGDPMLVSFLWTDGMDVLDDYGYLNVEADDLAQSNDMVRVACTAFYTDHASEQNVFLCSNFYGRWIGENDPTNTVISYDEGFKRSFMITEEDMNLLFKYGAYATH